MLFNNWAAACLIPLTIWILVSGLDDFWITLVFWWNRRSRFAWPSEGQLAQIRERRVAILLPLWHEHDVIRKMLEHNLAVLRYAKYDFFVGVYPNDRQTIGAVEEVARGDSRVHLALGAHFGPTSKGDCLNQAYRAMEKYERRQGVRYEIVVTHDAEDLIDPESLRLINWFSREYEMIQVPVLPLPTSLKEWTHGLYCDEFAEYQQKDIPVRQSLRGFIPSNGVGTGFVREALERLAKEYGQVFDPECLTEDYENGYRLHAAGCRQVFLPIRNPAAGPIATREYFPRQWRAAVRQRSRWVAGIALQGWQRHGWGETFSRAYWFWRDRKGLAGNLLCPAANLLFAGWLFGYPTGIHDSPVTGLAFWSRPWVSWICAVCAGIALVQMFMRMLLSARIYGLRFAAGAPLRMVWGNLINCAATVEALRLFLSARAEQHAPAWRKTEHVYPSEPLYVPRRPRLGEVLVSLQCLSAADVDEALARRPTGLRIGEYLVQLDKITKRDLANALRSQAGPWRGGFQRRETVHQAHRNFGLDST